MFRKTLSAVCLVLALIGTALAKGNFQAEGIVSEVRKNEANLAFKYVGSISLAYTTAPTGDPKRRWNSLTFDTANVLVRIHEWTERHDPSKQATTPDTNAVFDNLTALAAKNRKVLLVIHNPRFSFSNAGELTAIDGTYVLARESPY